MVLRLKKFNPKRAKQREAFIKKKGSSRETFMSGPPVQEGIIDENGR